MNQNNKNQGSDPKKKSPSSQPTDINSKNASNKPSSDIHKGSKDSQSGRTTSTADTSQAPKGKR